MKTGIELISEERQKGYNNLKEENFASDFKVINAGVQFAYANNSKLKQEVLIKAGALIAAELDRMQSEMAIKYCQGEDDIAFDNPAIAKPNVIGSPLSELEAKKKAAYDRADAAYYDRNSPHYRDNQRYSWAVKTIGEWSLSDCL